MGSPTNAKAVGFVKCGIKARKDQTLSEAGDEKISRNWAAIRENKQGPTGIAPELQIVLQGRNRTDGTGLGGKNNIKRTVASIVLKLPDGYCGVGWGEGEILKENRSPRVGGTGNLSYAHKPKVGNRKHGPKHNCIILIRDSRLQGVNEHIEYNARDRQASVHGRRQPGSTS